MSDRFYYWGDHIDDFPLPTCSEFNYFKDCRCELFHVKNENVIFFHFAKDIFFFLNTEFKTYGWVNRTAFHGGAMYLDFVADVIENVTDSELRSWVLFNLDLFQPHLFSS